MDWIRISSSVKLATDSFGSINYMALLGKGYELLYSWKLRRNTWKRNVCGQHWCLEVVNVKWSVHRNDLVNGFSYQLFNCRRVNYYCFKTSLYLFECSAHKMLVFTYSGEKNFVYSLRCWLPTLSFSLYPLKSQNFHHCSPGVVLKFQLWYRAKSISCVPAAQLLVPLLLVQ